MFKKFFSKLIPKKTGPLLNNRLDQKLVDKARAEKIPTLTQLKYIKHFLNPAEKWAIRAAITVIILTSLIWATIFFIRHTFTVPKDGGEYSEAMIGQPKYLNPLFASANEVDFDLTPLIYSGLFRHNSEQKLTPDLAANYTISADKKIYTVSLRQDVFWSDGEKFTADDVVYAFETIQNPETDSPLLAAFQGVVVEKINDYAVRFTLKEPFAPFLGSLTVGILPEHIWADFAPNGIKLAKNNLQPIGAGPWKFSKLVKDDMGNIQNYVLVNNERYYDKKPYLKTLNFRFYSDYSQAIDALRGQNVLALSFVPHESKNKIISKSLNVYNLRLPQYTAIFFNPSQSGDLKTTELRLALAKAIDKPEILDKALSGDGEILDAPIPPGSIGYYADIKKITKDVAGANQILDKKWTRLQPEEFFKIRHDALLKNYQAEIDALKKNASTSTTPEQVSSTLKRIEEDIAANVRKEMPVGQVFYRQNKDKEILSLTISTADTPEYARAAETIAQEWQAIGINANVQTLANRQMTREVLKLRNYQVLLYGEILGGDPDPYTFWHSSQSDYPGLNLAMFSNRNADKLLEEARGAAADKSRDELYKKFQNILVDELPAIFLYSPTHTFVVNKSIKGIHLDRIVSPADRYGDLSNWYYKTKWQWK